MEELLNYIQQNADHAHWLIFGALLLAGFNIPVSEDGMLFISALLAVARPDLMWKLFFGVYAGAYFSDLICFTLGRVLGDKLFRLKAFASLEPKVQKMAVFYDQHGIKTLLFGRFIPFGVRNALFLTAGIGKMNPIKFAISDLIACTISVSVYFYLYLKFGKSMIEIVKQANFVIFGVAIIVVGFLIYRNRKAKKSNMQEAT